MNSGNPPWNRLGEHLFDHGWALPVVRHRAFDLGFEMIPAEPMPYPFMTGLAYPQLSSGFQIDCAA
jgi:hypothetical protein